MNCSKCGREMYRHFIFLATNLPIQEYTCYCGHHENVRLGEDIFPETFAEYRKQIEQKEGKIPEEVKNDDK